MDVVTPVVGGGAEGNVVELLGQLTAHVVRWVVRAAEARSGGPRVQDDEVSRLEGRALCRREAVARRVVLAEGREEEEAAGFEHTLDLTQPRVLQVCRQVGN